MPVSPEKLHRFQELLAEAAQSFGLRYTPGQGFALVNTYDGWLPPSLSRDVFVVEQGNRLRVSGILEGKPIPSNDEAKRLKELAGDVIIYVLETAGREWAGAKPDLAVTCYRLNHEESLPPENLSPAKWLERYGWFSFWHLLTLIKAGSVTSEADVVQLMERTLRLLSRE
jgi:hypothetical protein